MLAKILEDMWVEPEVLEALSEEQRRILFLKMREEQVRRWIARDELEGSGGLETPTPKKGSSKHVTWLLGRDGDISVCVIGQVDDFRSSKLLLNDRFQSNGMNGIQTMTLLPERDTHQHNSKQHLQLLPSDEDDVVTPNDRSSEDELDSGSADDDPKDPAEEDSDSESDGCGAANLKRWPPRYRPHPSSHGNRPPLTDRLSGAERTHASDKVVAVVATAWRQEEKTTGRVAQLRRAFASSGSSGAFAKPPVPTKPPHLQKLATPLVH